MNPKLKEKKLAENCIVVDDDLTTDEAIFLINWGFKVEKIRKKAEI